MQIFSSDLFAGGGIEPALADKITALERLLGERRRDVCRRIECAPARPAVARLVHDESYVQAVLTGEPGELASSCGLLWNEALPSRALASLASAAEAATAAWTDGSAVALFAGEHHAHPGRGAGYCVFNGPAVAATTFREAGAERVLVVDLDAHFGGGTVDCLRGRDGFRHLDVAVDRFDDYGPSEGFELRLVSSSDGPIADRYLPTIEDALGAQPTGWPDALVYVNGVDPHELDSHAGVSGITDLMVRLRERILFEWIAREGVPVAVLVAGGYASFRSTPENVARLHLLAIDEAAGLG